jgi:hypothetical protein
MCSPTPTSRFSALCAAWLVAALVPACADQANPIVPGSNGPTGTTAGGGGGGGDAGAYGGDGMTALDDAGISFSYGDATTADQVSVTASDTGVGNCDLFAQQCGSPGLGCYPVGGAGRCEPAGSVGPLGSCTIDTDCSPGGVCVAMPGAGGFGNCQPICNLLDASGTACTFGYVCSPMPGFSRSTNVGRCISS